MSLFPNEAEDVGPDHTVQAGRPVLAKTDIYAGVKRDAALSPCGAYRYWLSREWPDGNGKQVCFLMLNPSTADHTVDDPTIRRCMGFAKRWGYQRLVVRNLFSLRATDPKTLLAHADPVGPAGDEAIQMVKASDLVVAAWGAMKADLVVKRERRVVSMMSHPQLVAMMCLEYTGGLKPKHPLYVKATADLLPWPPPPHAYPDFQATAATDAG